MEQAPSAGAGPMREVASYMLRLGATAFGGPAVHIAIMRRDLVQRRRWVGEQEYMDLLGLVNLIPGPNSTEMTMHLGGRRAGWAGVWIAGGAFILPAVACVLALAWLYVEYGTTPAGRALIWGITPLMLAIIVQAIWGLKRAALRSLAVTAIGALVLALALLDVPEVALILGAGVLALLLSLAGAGQGPGPGLRLVLAGDWLRRQLRAKWMGARLAAIAATVAATATLVPAVALAAPAIPAAAEAAAPLAEGSAGELFLAFLKIGSLLYGSGYVLAAFLEDEFVDSRGWLTRQQLVDAIAAGQFTPGPVFSSATFAGYVIDGVPGALAATAGIFLPSFLFVAITHPLAPRLREWRWTAPFLDGVNVAALVLMAVVTVRLARDALDDPAAAALFGAGCLVLWRLNPNTMWFVAAGALAGLVREAVR